MVIIGFCLNDFIPGFIALKKNHKMVLYDINDDVWLEVNPFLISHSHLYRLIMGTVIANKSKFITGTIRNLDQRGIDYDTILPKQYYTVYSSLEEIKRITSQKHIPLLLVILPFLKDFYQYAPQEKDQYNAILNIVQELQIPYIDMRPCFENAENWELFRYKERPDDYTHTNNLGHQLIAKTIHAYFDKKQLIK